MRFHLQKHKAGSNKGLPVATYPVKTASKEVAREIARDLNWRQRVFSTGYYFRVIELTEKEKHVC